ncbi:uncharacterized protein CCDC197 [Gouania willdenowi]|uniref:uncharacterized protein CCDC197 n=1 Tax=Gouania willdenowi TaxID=441366 RepID=UPI0010563844|nr:uncharacterized protein CCDC197 [Gouania willdenowi]
MSTDSLPFIENSLCPTEKQENPKTNIFVTQSEETRNKHAEENVIIPEPTETPSNFLDQSLSDLQKTQVLKKQAELDDVDKQLLLKQQEFKSYVEILAQRRSELESKHLETKESILKFEKFVAENEAKRRQAQKKWEVSREQNILKQREIQHLTERLKQLKAKNRFLKEKTERFKIFEDFLIKTQQLLPGNHLDSGSESLVMPIIRRHETLSITHKELLQCLERLEEDVEQGHRQLQNMKQDHNIKKLMTNKKLSELQSELDALKEKNKQVEVNVEMVQGLSRENVEEVGRLLMAINNLADLCYIPEYGPLDGLNVLTKMDMVKEYILDKADTERRVRRLRTSGSAITSTTAVTEKKDTVSMKSIRSKTLHKSSSKVSKSSEMFSR